MSVVCGSCHAGNSVTATVCARCTYPLSTPHPPGPNPAESPNSPRRLYAVVNGEVIGSPAADSHLPLSVAVIALAVLTGVGCMVVRPPLAATSAVESLVGTVITASVVLIVGGVFLAMLTGGAALTLLLGPVLWILNRCARLIGRGAVAVGRSWRATGSSALSGAAGREANDFTVQDADGRDWRIRLFSPVPPPRPGSKVHVRGWLVAGIVRAESVQEWGTENLTRATTRGLTMVAIVSSLVAVVTVISTFLA